MHRIGYILLFALVFLIFKAFFLDDYINKTNDTAVDINTSISEKNLSIEANTTTVADDNATPKIVSNSEFQKKMDDTPLDRFFNAIAEKLDQKL